MSYCLELAAKMTGSTSSGPPHPPKDVGPKTEQHQMRGKMTPRPQSVQQDQPMQLTPLWEHVVRTRRFPMSVDMESTFREIGERLRDPEWEVRQHALRVLVDVLPVLEQNTVDDLILPIVSDLVSNLGHPAPAVRKGALDTLRVYLCCSPNNDTMFQKILSDGFNRPDAVDNFQNTNVTTGIILSIPSLLFPSAGSPRPPVSVLKFAINALAARLIQVTHQEAALKSLAKIRTIIGPEEFDSHMVDYNANVKRDFEMLCDVYRVNVRSENTVRSSIRSEDGEQKNIVSLTKAWSTDSDSSGGTGDVADDEDQDEILVATMPLARVVLETEIKFDQATAITMTVLEEKYGENEEETESNSDSSDYDAEDVGVVQVFEDVAEPRKTPRRVRFGGEVIKLRTPESDEATVDLPEAPRTKIPLPLFPATKMPLAHRRSWSHPTSPSRSNRQKTDVKRSLSNSPRREIYMHNALLSPKKSILSRPSSPEFAILSVKSRKSRGKNSAKKMSATSNDEVPGVVSRMRQISETVESDEGSAESMDFKENDASMMNVRQENRSETDREASETKTTGNDETSNRVAEKLPHISEEAKQSKVSPKRSSRPTSKGGFDVFPKQERNYILMELSSPERKHKLEQKRTARVSDSKDSPTVISATNVAPPVTSVSPSTKDATASDQLCNIIIDNASTTENSSSHVNGFVPSQTSTTPPKQGRPNTSDATSQTTEETDRGKMLQPSQGSSLVSDTKCDDNAKKSTNSMQNDKSKSPASTDQQKSDASSGQTELANEKIRNYREVTNGKPVIATFDESESLTYSSSEGEGYNIEPSWEELGLVDRDTLDDLHNKEDWRAQIRGLERVASALKTTSGIAAVEPRLPSLLHAVLGGERSSRISSAGMNVVRVVLAGVSEDALKRGLPQLAWGLSRQGGPLAAQLARIAMLRLKPALLLDQLLEPQCIGAKNGKTRENTLQLLIFSLVTFPSTEFKVQTVARKVAEMVGDRRRRVRQASLDTLAVLAQIYETEEVLEAGERAAHGRHDSEAMKAAIRSRLARKSLPLVSADGLVVYGLQISPSVRIAIGPDVDWIVAGSGSLSPGSGRSRGQLIGMTGRLDSANAPRLELAKNDLWTDRQTDLVAVGVGIGPRNLEECLAWKLIPVQSNQAKSHGKAQLWTFEDGNVLRPLYVRLQKPLNATTVTGGQTLVSNKDEPAEGNRIAGKSSEESLRLNETYRSHCTSSKSHNSLEKNNRSGSKVTDHSTRNQRYTKDHLRKQFYELCKSKARARNDQPSQDPSLNKSESRIPVPHTRERTAASKDMSAENATRRGVRGEESWTNGKPSNEMLRRVSQEPLVNVDVNNLNKLEHRDENRGYGSMYQRRRRLIDGNSFQAVQIIPDVPPNQYPFPGQRYGLNAPVRRLHEHIDQDPRIPRRRGDDSADSSFRNTNERIPGLSEMTTLNYETIENSRGLLRSPENRSRSRSGSRAQNGYRENGSKMAPRALLETSSIRDTYGTIYQRRRRLIEGNAIRPLHAESNETGTYYSQQTYRYGDPTSETVISSRNTNRENEKTKSVKDSRHENSERSPDTEELPMIVRHESANNRANSYSLDRRRALRSRASENFDENSNARQRRDADKAVVEDEEIDPRRQQSSQATVYNNSNISSRNSQHQVTRAVQEITPFEEDAVRPVSAESTSFNISAADSHRSDVSKSHENQGQEDGRSYKSTRSHINRSSSPRSQRSSAFDIVPSEMPLSRRGSANSYAISLTSKRSSTSDHAIPLEFADPSSSSTDEELYDRMNDSSISEKRSHDSKLRNVQDDTDDTSETDNNTGDSNGLSVHSEYSNVSLKTSKESFGVDKSPDNTANSLRSKQAFHRLGDDDDEEEPFKESPRDRESRNTSISNHVETNCSRYDVSRTNGTQNRHLVVATDMVGERADPIQERILSSAIPDNSVSIKSLGSRSFQELDHPEIHSRSNSASVIRSSSGRSSEKIEAIDNSRDDVVDSPYSRVTPAFNDSRASDATAAKEDTFAAQSTDVSAFKQVDYTAAGKSQNGNGGTEISASKETSPTLSPEIIVPSRLQPSKVPRLKPKPRSNSIKTNISATPVSGKSANTLKITTQQCLNQLDNKDWEVITKGLKTLSQIARHHPEQLESFGSGTLGRILGRHVQNLRSQVSRAACLCAGEVFIAQPKGIEQEIDDIAGPLLHRTADTNRFLRADSNAALDHMVSSISPHKTIFVLIQRGATHQNPIVRATTGRLLSDVVDRIGPNQAMSLPRDVRDKLLVVGSKMLMDGNLDARMVEAIGKQGLRVVFNVFYALDRNHAKKMFRGLSRCGGFQKALKDAVPETTLRHIDKTLRTL